MTNKPQIEDNYLELCKKPVYANPDLLHLKIGSDCIVNFKRIGESILLSEIIGSLFDIDFQKFISHREKAITTYIAPGQPYFELCDGKLMHGTPSRIFLKLLKDYLQATGSRIKACFLFNLNKQLNIIFKSGLILERETNIYFEVCDSFESCLKQIHLLTNNIEIHFQQENIETENIPKIKNNDLENIKSLLASIIWKTDVNENFLSENEKIEEIYELIRFLKKDYHDTVESLKSAKDETVRTNQLIDRTNNILQSIFDNMNLAIALVALDTKIITHANKLLENLLELPKSKIVGKTCLNLFCYNVNPDCEKCVHSDSSIQNKEWKILKTPVLANVKNVKLDNIEFIMFSFFDNSYSKEIEKKNRNYQNNLILLSNCASDLLSINNTNSIFKYIGRGINEFISGSVVIVCKFNNRCNNFTLIEIFKDSKIISNIVETEYLNKEFSLNDEVFYFWLNERFKNITDENKFLPDVISDLHDKFDFLKNIYVSSLSFDTHLYGLVFVLTNKQKLENTEIIGSFVNQASMTLYKKELEEKLLAEMTLAQTSLKNREILLKEVHHRVKNNMAVISSLLKLQQSRIQDPTLDKAFNDSRDRIKSMALVHEKLYEGDDLEHIDFADYIRFLAKHLINSYKFIYVKFTIEATKTFVDLDTSIPLGLIINEIITNSLKYAFLNKTAYENGEKEAEIFVSIKHEFNIIKIVIGDNGDGIAPEFKIGKTHSLGLELIESLSHQIDSTITLSREKGTVYTIVIPNKLNK